MPYPGFLIEEGSENVPILLYTPTWWHSDFFLASGLHFDQGASNALRFHRRRLKYSLVTGIWLSWKLQPLIVVSR